MRQLLLFVDRCLATIRFLELLAPDNDPSNPWRRLVKSLEPTTQEDLANALFSDIVGSDQSRLVREILEKTINFKADNNEDVQKLGNSIKLWSQSVTEACQPILGHQD